MWTSLSLSLMLLEEEERSSERIIRRNLRDKANPLEMPEPIFVQHYRVNKAVFEYLLQELTASLSAAKKSFAAPPIIKLAACLRFFAEGGYQKGVGRDRDVSLAQSTFSQVLTEVLTAFERNISHKWIVFPKVEECRVIASKFYTKHGIPGVLGCVDGTHVSIVAPEKNSHLFYNRKGQYSLNVMLVCDDQCRIRFVDATHPGASHDAVIWSTGPCRRFLEEQYENGVRNLWLLGDSGYALEPWLLTPHRSAHPGSRELKFNNLHSECRNIIERTNGILKNRWRCLLGARQLHYQPTMVVQIINVCAALHNICIPYKSVYETGAVVSVEPAYSQEDNAANEQTYFRVTQRIRQDITNQL